MATRHHDDDKQVGMADADAWLAGFIVWLAGQRVPQVHRYRTHEEVERFLRWRATAITPAIADPRPAVLSYLSALRSAGTSEVMVSEVRALLTSFLDYCGHRDNGASTAHRPSGPRSTGSSSHPARPIR